MANTIKTINYEALGKDLLNKVMDMGLGTFSKTDIYDYILYIANKNSSDKFLYNRSNHDNAIDFKVTETKIKNSKMNISLKFKTDDERKNDLKDFLFKLSNKQIKILDKDEKMYVFYIDDYFVRMELENQLKKNIGLTLDYKLNTERVAIERADFIRRSLYGLIPRGLPRLKARVYWKDERDYP
jgi:hypothetical protein